MTIREIERDENTLCENRIVQDKTMNNSNISY